MPKTLVGWMLLILMLTAAPALAQEAAAFEPLADEAFMLQGVVPQGWQKAGPGLYARGSRAGDPTLLALQAAPVSAAALWPTLLPQLALTEAPASSGERQTAAFAWTLYQVDVTQMGVSVRVDLALAESAGRTYIALLQCAPDEYEGLHSAVFLPVVDALAPLAATEEPVPYRVEEVNFTNGAVTLAGTLTIPDKAGRHPAVALMTGSGPQDRDEMVVPGFPIFKRIADSLTRQGVAVLRYDDRGVGQSTGSYNSASIQDLASDGRAAVAFLKTRADINPDQVGVLGHSEGGIYAAILGADPDSGLAFIIALAGTAADGRAVLRRQNELLLRAAGASDALLQSQFDFLEAAFPLIEARDWEAVAGLVRETTRAQWDLLTPEERAALGTLDADAYAEQAANRFLQSYAAEWFASMLDYDPATDWAKTTVPVLALFGSLDLQVDAAQNAPLLETALAAAGNPDYTVITLEGANHLFQKAETGAVEEYAALPYEFTPELLPALGEWLLARVDVVD